MRSTVEVVLYASLLALGSISAAADEPMNEPDKRQYTYAWQFLDGDDMAPRGGTTRGPAVTLDHEASAEWLAIREPGLSAQERDRRAILAMAGAYRTSFDFIETVGFVEDYKPPRPYQSWGTEYVYVVANRPDFVSLQHIIVMFFETAEGEVSGPAVVKHWRQDWQYQDRELHVYTGHSTWERRRLRRQDVRGTWSQAVFQVDDSPRYQATGRWVHADSYSSWASEDTWRPLPRREFSVRDDYHALLGTNRHTITPHGWVHEEDNLKLVLDEDGTPRDETPYLAREAGFNRYERIVGHDFSAGDSYWEVTSPFWADVRSAWDELFESLPRITLADTIAGRSLFEVFFTYAGELDSSADYDSAAGQAFISETLDAFTDTAERAGSGDY